MRYIRKSKKIYFILLIIVFFSGCGDSSQNQNNSMVNVVQTDRNNTTVDTPPEDENNTIIDIPTTNDNNTTIDTPLIDNNNSTADIPPTNENNTTITGKVIDGEISGATLFLDLDRDNELDDFEPKTVTDLNGSFILSVDAIQQEHINYKNQTAPLIAFNGKDIRTDKPFEDYLMTMREDKTSLNITPFTTLIAQSLFSELDESKPKKVRKVTITKLKEKIANIKKNLAKLFGIKETLLDKNPIDLAKAGDSALLSKSLQLHKSARSMRKAMKRQVRKLRRSILRSYKALARELKRIKRDAIKKEDNPLLIVIETVMDDSELFDKNLVKDIKKETKSVIKEVSNFWKNQEGTLTDNTLSSAIKNMEEQSENGSNQNDSSNNTNNDSNQTDNNPTINPLFKQFNIGFGGSSSFPFRSKNDGEKIWVSAKNLVLDDNIANNSYYANIKDFNASAFSKLQSNLKNSKFITFWLTDGWKESWYNLESIQELMDAGYIPVFSYWYFGDHLVNGMPSQAKRDEYYEDNARVADLLARLNGKKIIIIEPEFNKRDVIKDEATQHKFASILSKAIDTIKAQNPDDLLVTLSMMDTGSRGVTNTASKCGYENCSLGDKYAWGQPEIVFNDLIDKLDFVSFHQMMAQFSRDYANPGGWDSPNPRKFSDDDCGVDFLADRIANLAEFMHEKYNKPVFMPYITVATGTWDDENNNSTIEDDEVDYYGWNNKAQAIYSRLNELKPKLLESQFFGYSVMALFDNPRHDYGGYQYFMNNEYHLGIIGSSATDETDIAPYGDLKFKGNLLETIFNPDSDKDGMTDSWEKAHGLDPLDSLDAVVDSDGDGYSNLFEYTHSSDPMSIGSVPYYQMSFLDSNLNFPTLNKAQQSDLDRFSRVQEVGEIRLHPVSKNWLRLSLIPKRNKNNTAFERQPVDIQNAQNPTLFTLVDDTNSTIPIDKTNLRRRTIYAPLRVADLRIKESVFIHTNQDLEIGKSYHLSVDSNLTGSTIDVDILFDPQNQISELLHVNSYGFRPEDVKKAYLGLMMGGAGEFEPTDLTFEVVKSSDNSVVYQGTATLEKSTHWRSSFSPAPYQSVYKLDFSSLKEVGEYYIRHSSGISQPFMIHSDAYRSTMNTLALGMYHQRRGEALKLPFTRFERKSTIEDATYIYDSNDLDPWLTSRRDWGDGIKYPTTLEGQKVEISGGHMDAGDYSPYTYNSAMTAWTLITTLDVFGSRVEHDNLGVPESGDGVSDLLQEFLIEINWLKDMQDPVDGGVFGMSKPKGMSYQSTMTGEDENLQRYLAPKDTTVTAGYAAALARASRSRVLQKYDKELATLLGKRAIKAWEWLLQNDGMHGYHHYGKSNGDDGDEGHEHARAWASIELYALTGEQKYHDAFVQYHRPLLRNDGVYWLNEGYGYTTRTLALWDRDAIPYPVDEALKKTSIQRFKGAMDMYVTHASQTPYGLVVDPVIKRWNIVGWYFPISHFSWDLLIAHELYQEPKYLEVAQDQIQFTLGANPSNMTYITGMGNKQLKSIVDQKSRFDKIEEPVVGLPISPMVTGYSWSNNYKRDISNFTYPRDNPDMDSDEPVYGILESAYDGWNINGEFTIEKLAGMLSCLAILTPKTDEVYDYPIFTLSTTSPNNGEFKPKIEFKNGSPKNYTIRWSENGKFVSSDSDYLLKQDFTKPIWKLSAEVITIEGRRWYDEIIINTRDYNNKNIPLEPLNEDNISSLFHFDNNLSDAKNRATELTLNGNAHFDNSNLNWMKTQTGSALRFDGIDDKITTIFHIADYLHEGNTTEDIKEVRVEGLFYIEGLDDKSNLLNLFYFRQSWGNGLKLTRYAWQDFIYAEFGKIQTIGEEINRALSFHSWHYIQMIRTKSYDILKVDGKEFVKVEHDAEMLFDLRDIVFEVGNFYGWVDEVEVFVEY